MLEEFKIENEQIYEFNKIEDSEINIEGSLILSINGENWFECVDNVYFYDNLQKIFINSDNIPLIFNIYQKNLINEIFEINRVKF